MSDRTGPIVHVDFYDTLDAESPFRGFHGSLEWVYQQLGRVVEDERRRADAEAFKAALAQEEVPWLPRPDEVKRTGVIFP